MKKKRDGRGLSVVDLCACAFSAETESKEDLQVIMRIHLQKS